MEDSVLSKLIAALLCCPSVLDEHAVLGCFKGRRRTPQDQEQGMTDTCPARLSAWSWLQCSRQSTTVLLKPALLFLRELRLAPGAPNPGWHAFHYYYCQYYCYYRTGGKYVGTLNMLTP